MRNGRTRLSWLSARNRDDLAKAALAEKRRMDDSADALREQYMAVEEGLDKLNEDIGRLEEKLADAKLRQKALITRHQTASHRLEVRKKIHDYKIEDALVRFEQFERKMETVEGRVEAYDLGRKKDLSQEFKDLENAESVEKDFRGTQGEDGRDLQGLKRLRMFSGRGAC